MFMYLGMHSLGRYAQFAALQEYASKRENPQEAAYNIGRAAHQLGLLHLAAPFYEKALACKPPPDGPEHRGAANSGGTRQKYDLTCEAAHNLALLYKATGAQALARQVMLEYLVI